MRMAEIIRNTEETQVKLSINLDGRGIFKGETKIGFLDHMLRILAGHSKFDIEIECQGDLQVDCHHLVEDIGITLGQAIKEALVEKKGIKRYGNAILPMDEALIQSALDISGRAYLNYNVAVPSQKVGNFDTELMREFIYGLVRNANFTLHIRQLSGINSHHILEAIIKSLARSLKEAVSINEEFSNEMPSTKGLI